MNMEKSKVEQNENISLELVDDSVNPGKPKNTFRLIPKNQRSRDALHLFSVVLGEEKLKQSQPFVDSALGLVMPFGLENNLTREEAQQKINKIKNFLEKADNLKLLEDLASQVKVEIERNQKALKEIAAILQKEI